MMEINRNNYETYFVDYLEGKLDERLVDSFIEFLQQNPDLKEELALFENVSVVPEDVSFSKKEQLYKEKYDSEKEFDTAAIAKLEGDLPEDEKAGFETYLAAHPEKQKDVDLFGKTKLHPDLSVTFSKKKKLYRRPLGKTVLLWSGRVAAVLILGLAVFGLLNRPAVEVVPENRVAEVKEKTSEKETVVETNRVQAETEKRDQAKKKNETAAPAVKKPRPEPKANKSLRETTTGRIKHEDLAAVRIPAEVPAEMASLAASLDVKQPEATLATMYLTIPVNQPEYYDERLLADVVKEKTGLDKFTFSKLTKAGLNLVTSLSNEKFTYSTDKAGKVTEYNYDSRLLAFSIPGKKARTEK